MAKGSRGGKRAGGGEGLNPNNILGNTNLLIDTDLDETTRGEVTKTLKNFKDEYGLTYENTRIAELKGKDKYGVLAYYDGAGIAINSTFLNSEKMNEAYQKCVESGFHPSSGSKSGMEAVVAHGINRTHESATAIVNEARKQTKHRGVVQMASKISGYATHSNAEAVAEAMSDVYCNGKKARAESRAIKSVVDKYLKN